MRTNSKEVRKRIRQHILDCVYNYDENKFKTFDEAKAHLGFEFNRVANYENNIQRIPNNQDRFSDYLLGLPFYFEYTYVGIENYLNSLGVKSSSDDKNIKLYHYLIFREVF